METVSVQVLEEDELYQQSLAHLQRGEWEHAVEAILDLQRRYGEGAEVDALLQEARFKATLDQEPLGLRRSYWRQQWERWRSLAPWLLLGVVVWGILIGGALAYQRMIVPARSARQEEIRLAQLRQRGQSYLAAKQYELALQAFQDLLTEVPDDPTALQGVAAAEEKQRLEILYKRAVQLVEMKEWSAALQVMDQIEAREPDYKGLADKRAVADRQLSLEAAFEEAEAAYVMGDWEQAQLGYEELRALDRNLQREVVSDHLFDTYVHRAEDLVATAGESLARVQEACELLAKALVLRPGDPQVVAARDSAEAYLAGCRAYDQGDWDRVAEALAPLNADRPKYAGGRAGALLYEAYLRKGQGYEAQGDQESALAAYQKALEVIGVDHSLAQARAAALTPAPASVEAGEGVEDTSTPTSTVDALSPAQWEYDLTFMGARSSCTRTGVQGVIRDHNGLPMQAVRIGLWSSAGILWRSLPSDADGQYEVIASGEPVADTWTVCVVQGDQPVSPSYSFRTSLGCVNGLQEYKIDWQRAG